MQDAKVDFLTKSGYRLTNKFCGTIPVGFKLGLTSCDLIFQRPDSSQELSIKKANLTSVAK
jgi:hypothetical protein